MTAILQDSSLTARAGGRAIVGPTGVAPSRSRYEELARRLVILIALYTIPAIVVMRPVDDPDIWWHLRTGQWIVEHGNAPTTDPFSIFGQEKPWVAYSWLFEVLIYRLYQAIGLSSILIFRVAMVLAVAAAIHRFVIKREPRFIIATGLVGICLMPIAYLMSERTWLFTVLFFTLTMDAVLDTRAGRNLRTTWLLPLVYLLWANLHIQFIHGLFLLMVACVSPLIDRFFGLGEGAEYAARAGSRVWWQLVAVSAVCLLATFVNPYHVGLYGVAIGLATQPGVKNMIEELLAMDFRSAGNWALLALAMGAAFALGRRRRVSSFEGLLLIAAAYFSFQSRRDCFFMALTAAAILTTGDRQETFLPDRFLLTPRRVAALGIGIVLVLAIVGWSRGLSVKHLEQAVGDKFPAQAAAFVEKQGYGGPLYNSYDWGGYLIWRLPALPVAIDGRAYVHGDERILRSIETWSAKPGWDRDPELNGARVIIGDAKAPLVYLLRKEPHFKLVHEDQLAVVFVATSDSIMRK